jgi:hypothetical protein
MPIQLPFVGRLLLKFTRLRRSSSRDYLLAWRYAEDSAEAANYYSVLKSRVRCIYNGTAASRQAIIEVRANRSRPKCTRPCGTKRKLPRLFERRTHSKERAQQIAELVQEAYWIFRSRRVLKGICKRCGIKLDTAEVQRDELTTVTPNSPAK